MGRIHNDIGLPLKATYSDILADPEIKERINNGEDSTYTFLGITWNLLNNTILPNIYFNLSKKNRGTSGAKKLVDIGLKMREAMLINSLLFNSEAWHGVEKEDIKKLEKVDELLLRSLLGSHQKTPIEFLYLETGSFPISFLVYIRRIVYLRNEK